MWFNCGNRQSKLSGETLFLECIVESPPEFGENELYCLMLRCQGTSTERGLSRIAVMADVHEIKMRESRISFQE